MKFAQLMRHRTPDRLNGGRIQGRPIGGDPVHRQLACLQGNLKATEQGNQIGLCRIVVEHLEKEPFASSIVHDGQDTKGYLNRWTQPDSIIPNPYNPQSLNRYAYTLNNPVKYTDSTGHCPEPKGMGAAICVALFIEPKTVTAGPFIVHGDGRTFSSNSDPEASRGYIWISTDANYTAEWMNKTGYLTTEGVNDGKIEWTGPSSANTWTVTRNADGSIDVSFDLVLAGPLEKVAPRINGTVTFSPDGKGGYSAHGIRDGFPWAEAYYWDAEGNVHKIFQSPAVRGDPYDLTRLDPDWKRILADPFRYWSGDSSKEAVIPD